MLGGEFASMAVLKGFNSLTLFLCSEVWFRKGLFDVFACEVGNLIVTCLGGASCTLWGGGRVVWVWIGLGGGRAVYVCANRVEVGFVCDRKETN